MKKSFSPAFVRMCIFILLTILFAGRVLAQDKNSNIKSGYVPVNGLKMYYEIHGAGQPLVLIHGSFMNINLNFGSMIPELSKKRQVIALELQGHGRTADIDRPFTFENMADDVAALLKYLKIDSADFLGYSLGGEIAMQIAIRHPAIVHKLVIISSAFKFDGWYPETQSVFPMLNPKMFEGTPVKKQYDSLAPDPKHFADFVNKLKILTVTKYDFTAAAIKSMNSPIFMIIGDSDGVQPEHAVEIFRLRGGGRMGDMGNMSNSRLAIFPATTHVGIMMHPEWLLEIIPPYLDAPIRAGQ